jgi:hypothetical protein
MRRVILLLFFLLIIPPIVVDFLDIHFALRLRKHLKLPRRMYKRLVSRVRTVSWMYCYRYASQQE